MHKFKITEKTVNFLLIFILGFLVGVALKSEAQKRITIGFNDYLVPEYKQDIDLMSPNAPQDQNQNQPQNQDEYPGESANQDAEQNNLQPAPGANNQ